MVQSNSRTLTRRRALLLGVGGLIGAGAGGVELVAQGVLPGKHTLDLLDGACSVAIPAETFVPAGPSITGQFFSRARGRTVGYTIAYPPGYAPGSRLPLGVVLHAFGGNHATTYGGLTLAHALAGATHHHALAPIALASADGGGLYWNPHPDDNPLAMLVDELIPMCQSRGLGRAPRSIGVTGISMGGHGAILLAERHPDLIAAVAAISPAVWTSYNEAHNANPGAFASAEDFARYNIITHAPALASTPVRITSGNDDPFHPGVLTLTTKLPPSVSVTLVPGCHDESFFASQQHPSLAFLARHIAHT